MNELKVVYAIFLPSGRERTIVDALRLFASPQTKHAAHITVRGPYPDYQDPREWSAKTKGQVVNVGGVGTFFAHDQNTVYLGVESQAIRGVWDKPNYPEEYNPHLTIYDGSSRPFAESLRDLLTAVNPRFLFRADGLEPMVIGNGHRPLLSWYDPSEIDDFMAHPPTADDVRAAALDDAARLSWIGDLAEYLAYASEKPNGRPRTVRAGRRQ